MKSWKKGPVTGAHSGLVRVRVTLPHQVPATHSGLRACHDEGRCSANVMCTVDGEESMSRMSTVWTVLTSCGGLSSVSPLGSTLTLKALTVSSTKCSPSRQACALLVYQLV